MTEAKKKYTNCDHVYKKLQRYLSDKKLESGDRVPSERQIAEDLDVNRTTLRSAIHRMVKEGLIDRQVGVGTFSKVSPKSMIENYVKITTIFSPAELMETRLILEPQIANIAAINISKNDIIELRAICKNSDAKTFHDIEKHDIDFNSKLAVISKNNMLNEIYSVVSRSRKKLVDSSTHAVNGMGFISLETWQKYQNKILMALENRDPKAAQTAVTNKLNNILSQYSLIAQAEYILDTAKEINYAD